MNQDEKCSFQLKRNEYIREKYVWLYWIIKTERRCWKIFYWIFSYLFHKIEFNFQSFHEMEYFTRVAPTMKTIFDSRSVRRIRHNRCSTVCSKNKGEEENPPEISLFDYIIFFNYFIYRLSINWIRYSSENKIG